MKCLQEYVSKITEQDRKNPHIKFFENINPGWNKVGEFWVLHVF